MTDDRNGEHRVIDVYVFRCRSMARYEIDSDVVSPSASASTIDVETVSMASLLPSNKMSAQVIGLVTVATKILNLIISIDH